MRFSTVAIFGALAAMAAAQNPFTRTSYEGITAGQTEDITWEPTSQGTVTIKLVQGDPKDLTQVQTLATGIINDGSYSWTPATTLPAGSDYALQIVDDLNPEATPNYTQLFSIESDVKAAASSSSATTTETTTVASSTVTETSSTTATETSSEESSTEASTSTEVVTSTSTNTKTSTASTESSSASATETDSESSTTMESSTRRTSSVRTSSAAPTAATTTAVTGAAPSGGAKVAAGLVGFVGAAVLLL